MKPNRFHSISLFVPLLIPLLLVSLSLFCFQTAMTSAESTRAATVALSDLRITELMYQPLADATYSSADYEFIELTNFGTSSVDMGGVSLRRGITYTFDAGTTLGPNGTLVLASNPTAFQARYGSAPHNTIGYVGKLRNGGETIILDDAASNELLNVKYDDDDPLLITTKGLGFSLVPTNPTVTPKVRGDWRVSAAVNGSPGVLGSTVNRPSVLVNEVLAHTDLPEVDFIELYNAKGVVQNIGGWALTDDLTDLTRFVIPAGTTIAPFGYLTFDQNQLGFAFNSEGDSAYLIAMDVQRKLTGYAHGFTFGASPNGISLGRCTIANTNSPNAIDEEKLVLQNVETMGTSNSLPQVGPIVISEFMYNGLTNDEFIELANISSNPVPLYDPASPANRWRIRGAGTYTMPSAMSIPANGTLLVVSTDPVTFRNTYNIPNTIAVVGPYSGRLNNDGERISLDKPDVQNTDGTVPYYEIDGVDYNDALPWPLNADGAGKSLERVMLSEYGDGVINWTESAALNGTPGRLSVAQQGVEDNVASVFLPIMSNGQNLNGASLARQMPQENPCFSNP